MPVAFASEVWSLCYGAAPTGSCSVIFYSDESCNTLDIVVDSSNTASEFCLLFAFQYMRSGLGEEMRLTCFVLYTSVRILGVGL
jgi:hypothetical protein